MDAFDEDRDARPSVRTRGSMALASSAARSAHRRSRSDRGGAAAPVASVRVVAVMRNAVEAAPHALEAAQRAVEESAFAVYSVKKVPQRAHGRVSTKHIKARRCGRAGNCLAGHAGAFMEGRPLFAVPSSPFQSGGPGPGAPRRCALDKPVPRHRKRWGASCAPFARIGRCHADGLGNP